MEPLCLFGFVSISRVSTPVGGRTLATTAFGSGYFYRSAYYYSYKEEAHRCFRYIHLAEHKNMLGCYRSKVGRKVDFVDGRRHPKL